MSDPTPNPPPDESTAARGEGASNAPTDNLNAARSPVAVAEEALRRADRAFEGLSRSLDTGGSSGAADGSGINGASATDRGSLRLLDDVDLDVRIELGRTRMLVEDVLRLGADSVVELDKAAGDPVDIYVNGRHIARGEVLVVNENFCVRVSEILEPLGRHPGAA